MTIIVTMTTMNSIRGHEQKECMSVLVHVINAFQAGAEIFESNDINTLLVSSLYYTNKARHYKPLKVLRTACIRSLSAVTTKHSFVTEENFS